MTACVGLLVGVTAHAAGPVVDPNVPAKAIAALDKLFAGPHPGSRAVHAKGVLCEGTFYPAPSAADISRAPHLAAGGSTSILVRFSNFSGVPDAADNDPLASPRGMAIKFKLPDGGDTDIVAHSYDGFPVATPDDFVTFVTALASPDPNQLTDFVAKHPAARAFVEAPKPAPVSYATESYFGVNAFAFSNQAGDVRYGRYRIVPLAGASHLSAAEAASKSEGYLAHDVGDRLQAGQIRFRLDLQLAAADDKTYDGSVPWPASRQVVPLGTIVLNQVAGDGAAMQRNILFNPLNLVDGILPSDDPMLVARSRSYRLSHIRRSSEASLSAVPSP